MASWVDPEGRSKSYGDKDPIRIFWYQAVVSPIFDRKHRKGILIQLTQKYTHIYIYTHWFTETNGYETWLDFVEVKLILTNLYYFYLEWHIHAFQPHLWSTVLVLRPKSWVLKMQAGNPRKKIWPWGFLLGNRFFLFWCLIKAVQPIWKNMIWSKWIISLGRGEKRNFWGCCGVLSPVFPNS